MGCICEKRDGVFGALQVVASGQCQALANRAVYNPLEIFSDSGYFSTRFVEQAALAYEAAGRGTYGDSALYDFRVCVYQAIYEYAQCGIMNLPAVPGPVRPICNYPPALNRTAMNSRLVVLAQRAKESVTIANTIGKATQVTTSAVPGKLTANLPLIQIPGITRPTVSSTTVRIGTGVKITPPIPTPPLSRPTAENPIPMPMPGITQSDFVTQQSQISLEERVFNGYKYVAASLADAGSMIAVLSLAGQAGTKVTGTKDFSGARWSVINSNVTAESNDPALLLSGLVANGDAIIMTADAESVYITGTKFIEKAAELCPPGQSEIFVLQDPAPGWQTAGGQEPPAATSDGTPPSNTMLYVGLGVGAAALIGVGVYFATRKQ
jgi:hypothetical protein